MKKGLELNVIGIIQARMTSSRLPGKILYPLASGIPALVALITRLKKIRIEWWLATTDNKEDDIISIYGNALGIKVFRGSEKDVLSRFENIARLSNSDWILRVTADNPLTDPKLTKMLIEQAKHANKSQDLISDSIGQRNFPQGLVPYIIRTSSLLSLRKKISSKEKYHLTHVTSKVTKSKHAKFKYFDKKYSKCAGARLTLDVFEDYLTISSLIEKLGNNWINCNVNNITKVLNANPEILSYNRHISQKKLSES